jgi:hypothetical protein
MKTSEHLLMRPLSRSSQGAPSVYLPENVIPSAGMSNATFQSLVGYRVVRLPESFRGGCSFGVGQGPISPAAIGIVSLSDPSSRLEFDNTQRQNSISARAECHH